MPRHAPTLPLPPYSFVPGHGLPHPVNDCHGHLHAQHDQPHEPSISEDVLSRLPTAPARRHHALAGILATTPEWLFALDLFNDGFYWEAHEAWENLWNHLGRTTAEAALVQGLIHVAAACVKIREGRPNGVARHAHRGRELLANALVADQADGVLGITASSLKGVLAELDAYKPACWHTNRAPVVRVIVARLELGASSTA